MIIILDGKNGITKEFEGLNFNWGAFLENEKVYMENDDGEHIYKFERVFAGVVYLSTPEAPIKYEPLPYYNDDYEDHATAGGTYRVNDEGEIY